jgi:hypothetical protein
MTKNSHEHFYPTKIKFLPLSSERNHPLPQHVHQQKTAKMLIEP